MNGRLYVRYVNQKFDDQGKFLGADEEALGDGQPAVEPQTKAILAEVEACLNSIRLVPRKEAGP